MCVCVCVCVCVYKMYPISAEGYKNADAHTLIIKKTGSGMGVKNISDLILKEMHGGLKTKNPTKEQINKYKMTEREIYEVI